MEGLYKVDNIEGKGFGWIALQDIKVGTLICKEKPQFIPQKVPKIFSELPVLMDTFLSMNETDQKEFLNLSNSFLDLNSLNDEMKEYYFDVEKFVKNQSLSDSDKKLMLKIICIHQTNSFGGVAGRGVGIKVSRINHSCCPNCENIFNEGEIEITANENISAGQEITISYVNDFKKFKERQENCHKLGFVCSCELCQNEEKEINHDDESYEKFQNLKEESEKAYATSLLDKDRFLKNYDEIKKAISCQTKMYNMAGKKKAPKAFTHQILNQAFMYGSTGMKKEKCPKNTGIILLAHETKYLPASKK